MSVTLRQITERFSQLLELKVGSPDFTVNGVNAPDLANETQLIFITENKHLNLAKGTRSTAWVIKPKLLEAATQQAPTGTALLVCKDPMLAMALVSREYFPILLSRNPFDERNIHPTAVIHSTAQLDANVTVGPNTTIGAHVHIETGAVIGPNTTIEPEVHIGANTHIHAQVYIAARTRIGAQCEIHPQTSIGTEGFGYAWDAKGEHHRQTHYGRVVIEDNVHIGAGVQIDRGTFHDSHIGRGTIIDNHCHFGHNIKIGKGTIITGGMITAGSVTIGDRCVFGGRTSIAGHLSIASGSHVAGLSGVNTPIEFPGQYGGYPLQPLKHALKTSASLSKLPELRRNVSRIMKKLGLEANKDEE